MQTQPENIVKANSVIDVKVKDKNGENLGKIEEIMIDKMTGKVNYVVLSFGGILGMGEKLFALPWRSISYSSADECFILNATKETLKNAPGFDKNNWPNMADKRWEQSIHSYYGIADTMMDETCEVTRDVAANANETIKQTGKEVKQSGKDWLSYVQNHPVQSVIFSIIGYFAVKGMTKE